jgi:hypothetical protein
MSEYNPKKYSGRNSRNFKYSQLRLTYCFAAFLAFLGGIAIYAFFRNLSIVLFQFVLKPSFLDLLHFPVRTDSLLVSMFLFNLPDGLWFLSGLLLIRAVWLTDLKWRAIYAGLFALLALAMETAQIFDAIPGTFDFLDIAFMAFFALAESIIFNLSMKRRVL